MRKHNAREGLPVMPAQAALRLIIFINTIITGFSKSHTMEADMGFRNVEYWFYDRNAKPDFKQLVEKSLALFGVFTGVTLSFYIKDFLFGDNIPVGFLDFSVFDRVLISASVIALLLRYIVGSAVHLNATYVAKVTTRIVNNVLVEEKQPKLEKLGWLFFDIVILVAFGLLAVVIIYSSDLDKFLLHSAAFIAVGLAWSVIAFCCREGDQPVAARWLAIDGFQLAVTIGLYFAACWSVTNWSDFTKTWMLAPIYIGCLFLDFCVVSRPPPTLGVTPLAAAPAVAPALPAVERAALAAELAAMGTELTALAARLAAPPAPEAAAAAPPAGPDAVI
jgi:hypothetical protein